MRRLLRPWLEEGSVILYELDYDGKLPFFVYDFIASLLTVWREESIAESVKVGSVYQTHVLRLCEKHVLTTSSWVIHHDVDEFLMVDAPGWSSPLPARVSTPASELRQENTQWTYPLHSLFAQLRRLT